MSSATNSIATSPTTTFPTITSNSPVARYVERSPAGLAVRGSRPAGCRNLFSRKRGFIAHNLSLSSIHNPDMTETLLKGSLNACHTSIRPSISSATVTKCNAKQGSMISVRG